MLTSSRRLPSPDGQSVAIVESVDNGLGFGQGMLYDEVHVGPTDHRTVGHFGSMPTLFSTLRENEYCLRTNRKLVRCQPRAHCVRRITAVTNASI